MAEVSFFPEVLTQRLLGAMDEAIDKAGDISRTLCPVDTGALKASIRDGKITDRVGFIFADSPAMFVEFDTRPHEIFPKRKKALAFDWRGEHVIFAHVHHPGTDAQPFLRPAAAAFPFLYEQAAKAALA